MFLELPHCHLGVRNKQPIRRRLRRTPMRAAMLLYGTITTRDSPCWNNGSPASPKAASERNACASAAALAVVCAAAERLRGGRSCARLLARSRLGASGRAEKSVTPGACLGLKTATCPS